MPVPTIIECYPGSPDERLLKSKLNPPSSGVSDQLVSEGDNYITDDTNIETFMEFLIKLIVKVD